MWKSVRNSKWLRNVGFYSFLENWFFTSFQFRNAAFETLIFVLFYDVKSGKKVLQKCWIYRKEGKNQCLKIWWFFKYSFLLLGIQRSISNRISLRREKEKFKKLQRLATMPGKWLHTYKIQYILFSGSYILSCIFYHFIHFCFLYLLVYALQKIE